MGIKQKVGELYWGLRSVRFDRKLIMIESDDWGSLRTESTAQRDALNMLGLKTQKEPYIQLDGLADVNDLSALFEVLSSVKDERGNHAKLIANVCTANPDFNRIKDSGFMEFYYESFHQTIARKNRGTDILKLWHSGIEEGVFYPQLHGREHLHALAWLAELQQGNKDLLKAFELGSWGIPYESAVGQKRRGNLQAALDVYGLQGESEFQKQWLFESSQIFEAHFGYASKTFIPPAYTWHSRINQSLNEIGVQSLQGIKLQYQPMKKGYKRKMRFMGEEDAKHQIRYFPRNVFFEPALFPDKDWYSETLKGIEKAFANKQPAIIGSHRINFIGKLKEENRTRSLYLLNLVLKETLKRHPKALFITSDKLIEYL